MKTFIKYTGSIGAAFLIAACSGPSETAEDTSKVASDGVAQSNPISESEGSAEMDTMHAGDHADMDHHMASDTGHTTGTIVTISPDGKNVTIDHEAIGGVNMGAMTMGFGATSDVDLSAFSKGDRVSFMVKRGRDNSYRVTAICDMNAQGDDCLHNLMPEHMHD